MVSKKKCKLEGCERTAVARGMCWPCYRSMYRMVRIGKTTWKSLSVLESQIREEKLAVSNAAMNAAIQAGLLNQIKSDVGREQPPRTEILHGAGGG